MQFAAFLLLVGTFGGCRGIKYLMYYPHPVLGVIQPSAEWQEFTVSPLTLEQYDYLAVKFNSDGWTICQNNLSAFHLCSPAAKVKYNRELDEYRRFLNQTSDSEDPKFKFLEDEMTKIVEAEPLPDLQIELLTESGEVEKYEAVFYGGATGSKLSIDFHNCNQTAWDRDKLAAGQSEESAKYSYEEINAHAEKCSESHAKAFVKMRLRSPAGMKIVSIKIESGRSPFAIR
jgi:hypothetical protein